MPRYHTRFAIAAWALITWMTANIAAILVGIIAKSSGAFHPWSEMFAFESTLAIGSVVLLRRDGITARVAGIGPGVHSFPWFRNLALLVGLNTTVNIFIFAVNAPDTTLSTLSAWQRVLWACIIAPCSEELFARGWFQTSYQNALGISRSHSAVLASATLFAVMHVSNSDSSLRTMATVAAAFLSGLIFARVRQVCGSLLPGVILHSVFNASGWLIAKPLWFFISKR